MIDWIRTAGQRNYHALAVDGGDTLHTYCDRSIGLMEIEDRSRTPNSRCACCILCIAHPQTIRGRMRELLLTRNAALEIDRTHDHTVDRHGELDRTLDELLACYFAHHPGSSPGTTSVADVAMWSHAQTQAKGDRP